MLWNYNLIGKRNIQEMNHHTIQDVKRHMKWAQKLLWKHDEIIILVARPGKG